MATLETHYKNYLETNPDPVLSFEDWKIDFGERLKSGIEKLEKEIKEKKDLENN